MQPVQVQPVQQGQGHVLETHSSTGIHVAAGHSVMFRTAGDKETVKKDSEREVFYERLHAFRDSIGEPIQRLPTLGFKELDLWVLYKEVIRRGGIDTVIANKQWKEVAEALQLPSSCTDSGFRLRLHYKKYLEAFERKFFVPPPPSPPRSPATVSDRELGTLAVPARGLSPGSSSGSAATLANSRTGSSGSGSSVDDVAALGSGTVAKRASGTAIKISEATSKSGPERFGTAQASKDIVKARVVKKKKRSGTGVVLLAAAAAAAATAADVTKWSGDQKKDPSSLGCRASTVTDSFARGRVANGREVRKNRLDFSVLDDTTLRRYASVYSMGEKSCNRKELADSISAHFCATPLAENVTETLVRFISAVRGSSPRKAE